MLDPGPFPCSSRLPSKLSPAFRDREKAQLPQAFAQQAWGLESGTFRKIALRMADLSPKLAAKIAGRLLTAGRADEAWQILEATEYRRGGWPDFEWEDARIDDVLDARACSDEAQAARWSCFERALSAPHLRQYLKRLPEFEDFEAEQRALDHAERYGSLLQAISFLVSWPPLDRAARTITARAKELDGDHYELLTPAADALAAKYPLAATLLLRAMIDFSLMKSRTSRYGHAARHLRQCQGLASAITDYASFEPHDVYVSKLRKDHERKTCGSIRGRAGHHSSPRSHEVGSPTI